ncbi:CRAL-TRIO domain-containing protein [Blyttiomyces helicus]|uniref:CRAL-TRIO domain-containing protein n=1 Tax=Blyttiomyces helicus TaxID=388810 RepID=A0A4P9W6Y2_9FUNG|nr:CRAL-TRIO domain-containing protein [Blyttiomyces helicus]|eukprot:RKO85896.1 CRAL-TRIO domain-containing protein [Blyttiomyces helicus]
MEQFCDDACLLRYLRATRWIVEHSAKRLEATLAWRLDYKPHLITPEEVEPEALTGKEYLCGFDLAGRPLLFLVPRNENTKTYDRQVRFVVWNLERTIRAMPPGIEHLTLVIDYENMSMFNAPPLSISKRVLSIIGDHYPERLGVSFVINPSWYLWGFFKLIGPFLDPVTRAKIRFVNLKKQHKVAEAKHQPDGGVEGTGGWDNIINHVDPNQLVAEYGGAYPFKWDFATYWKHVTA